MTHSSWIFCINLASCVARSGCRRKKQNPSESNNQWPCSLRKQKHSCKCPNHEIVEFVIVFGSCFLGQVVYHLLAPRRLEALELLHVASIEGVECIDEPLLVCVPQRLQHRMHQLQTHISRQQSSSKAGKDSCYTAAGSLNSTLKSCLSISANSNLKHFQSVKEVHTNQASFLFWWKQENRKCLLQAALKGIIYSK